MLAGPDTVRLFNIWHKFIEKEVLKWPVARRVELAEMLVASVEGFATEEIETAWDSEVARRVSEIQQDRAVAIPAEKVMAEARKSIDETRRLSSAGGRRTH